MSLPPTAEPRRPAPEPAGPAVALVSPPPARRTERWDRPDFPHVGLAYLAAALRGEGIPVSVVDGKLERVAPDEVVARLAALRPRLVGLTSMTHEIVHVAGFAAAVKAVLPGTTVVVGGVHATALPTETLRDFPAFDAAVFGEGERTLPELARALEGGSDLGAVRGLAWRRGHEVVPNPPRPWLTGAELDALPRPAWDLFPPARTYPLLTARGCPFPCVFCARPYGRQVRSRSTEAVVAEMLWLLDAHRPGYVKVYDETFGLDRRRAAALLDAFLEAGVPRRTRWWAMTRVSTADAALVEHMARAGCDYLGFGVESGSPRVLREAAKDVDLDKAVDLVRAARRAGVTTEGFFIIGLPHEDRETAWETIRFAARLRTDHVAFGVMVPYPGTAVLEMARRGEGGYRLLSTDWRDFNKQLGNALEMEALPRAEMERLQLLGYLYFYWRNLRLLAFSRFCWENRAEGVAFARGFLPKLLRGLGGRASARPGSPPT